MNPSWRDQADLEEGLEDYSQIDFRDLGHDMPPPRSSIPAHNGAPVFPSSPSATESELIGTPSISPPQASYQPTARNGSGRMGHRNFDPGLDHGRTPRKASFSSIGVDRDYSDAEQRSERPENLSPQSYVRRYATSSRGQRSSLGGVYSGRSSRNGRLPSVDPHQRTQGYRGNDEFSQEWGAGKPMSSFSGETDSGLIGSFDADPNGRHGLPHSPVMGRMPSSQVSRQSIIEAMSDGSRTPGFRASQPRMVDFNGRPSNEGRLSKTASPSGGRGDDLNSGLAYGRSHDEQ
ncbi:MAG: hypothetical protein Q9195_002165 [Heterodermia aff. obscurata]